MGERLSMYWLAFTGDTNPEAAKRRFQERFGYAPTQVKRERGLLLLGPILEREPHVHYFDEASDTHEHSVSIGNWGLLHLRRS